MKIVPTLFLCVVALLISGCAAGITRTGYQLPKNRPPGTLQKCPIALQCNTNIDRTSMISLGSIQAYDNGLSMDCDEAGILDTFCKDGCLLGADVINITDEHPPDLWSTCYRAKAEFLRFKDRDKAKGVLSDAKYAPQAIIDRTAKASKRTRAELTAMVFGGVLGGLIYWQVTK